MPLKVMLLNPKSPAIICTLMRAEMTGPVLHAQGLAPSLTQYMAIT